MANLIFRYGTGKTADLCQVAYNYQEGGKQALVLNASQKPYVKSHVTVKNGEPLQRKVDLKMDENTLLYNEIFQSYYDKIAAILIDDAHLLTEQQAVDLFLISKVLNIDVICYGERAINGQATRGAMRLMELTSRIQQVDGIDSSSNRFKLQFFYGAMNCSKSAKLLYKNSHLTRQGLKVAIVKPAVDRDVKMVQSRIGLEKPADIVLQNNDRIYGEGEYLAKAHVNYILVDEAQFLSIDQINDLYQITRDYQIPVRCYGLKMDFSTRHFPGSGRLLEIADYLEKMPTICGDNGCKGDAEFNARKIIGGDWEKDGEQIVVDDAEHQQQRKYVSLCATCYLKNVWKIDPEKPKMLVK